MFCEGKTEKRIILGRGSLSLRCWEWMIYCPMSLVAFGRLPSYTDGRDFFCVCGKGRGSEQGCRNRQGGGLRLWGIAKSFSYLGMEIQEPWAALQNVELKLFIGVNFIKSMWGRDNKGKGTRVSLGSVIGSEGKMREIMWWGRDRGRREGNMSRK